jgi:SAM-dependent methyltransferase
MKPIYRRDLAYIQSVGFGTFAEGAAPEIIRRLKSTSIRVRRVLEIGCGAGPLAAVLFEAGFEVTGLDASGDLLRIARKKAPKAVFIQGSLYATPLPACEAILAVGEPLTYCSDSRAADSPVESFFRRASDALPVGGLLIFDVIESGEPSLNGRSWISGEDWAVLVETTEDASSCMLIRHIETFRRLKRLYRRGHETHRIRLFETEKLRRELAAYGFSTETAVSYGAQPLGPRRRAFFCTRTS